jgi:transposase
MRHVAGQSNREIARAEGRDRGTIAKIVKSTEMAAFVEEMKERFRGLAPLAMETIEHALRVQQDAKIAYQVLSDLGIAPQKGEQPQQPVMTTEEEMVKEQMTKMAYIAYETARVYGGEMPAPEQFRKETNQEETSKNQLLKS